MKILKTYKQLFENLLIENEIFTINHDKLIINDVIRDYFLYEKQENMKNKKLFCEDRTDAINKFLSDTRNSSFRTCFHFTYGGMYSMSIDIKKAKYNNSNNFTYFISGISVDFVMEMHQKGMIRATRTINLEVIKHFFPDVKRDKQYRDFEKGLIKFSELGLNSERYERYLKNMKAKEFNL